MNRLTCLYFSATTTTARSVDAVAKSISLTPRRNYNLADDLESCLFDFTPEDVVIVGMPVYGGRIPGYAIEKLKNIKGNGATAIAMVVYGNRDYDDALLELCDFLVGAGFNIAAAGAFIGQHSIFPKVAKGRPDAADLEKLAQFGRACSERINCGLPYGTITPKGNRPYKIYAGVPFIPYGSSKKCRECDACSDHCPVHAIDMANPYDTNRKKCLSCGRCISLCRYKARYYKGLKYNIIGLIFKASFSKRKEPEWIIAE